MKNTGDSENSRIIIKAVGDICPGDKYMTGLGVLSKSNKFGSAFPLKEAGEYLQGADLLLGNFEGLLTTKTRAKNGANLSFCGLPEFAHDLFQSGFSVLNVANNHSLEHGPEIFLESVECLKSAGIQVCGLRSNEGKFYSEPVVFSVKGQRIGILGYNWVGADNFKDADNLIAQSHDSIVNYTWERKKFKKPPLEQANQAVIQDINNLRAQVDLLVLMAHWGYEYVTVPPYNLTLEAHSFIDAGVDIIIGSHPHVLQGMEAYKHGLIFYSLGNFIFDFREKLPKCTAVLDVMISKDKNFSHTFNPLYINNLFQPRRATEQESKYIHSIIAGSNEALASPGRNAILEDDSLYKRHEDFYNRLKFKKIIYYVLASLRHPWVVTTIFRKGFILLKILRARIRGQRVRW
jgi:poly-gamma-glutamate synthesis protein (capsule biosynthesis protein)